MNISEFDYELPKKLIAQFPAKNRDDSRLLVVDRQTGKITHSNFKDLSQFIKPGNAIVLNDTKVMQGRFFAQRLTGGRLEGLFLSERGEGFWEACLKGAGKVKAGEEILIKDKQGEDYYVAAEKASADQ